MDMLDCMLKVLTVTVSYTLFVLYVIRSHRWSRRTARSFISVSEDKMIISILYDMLSVFLFHSLQTPFTFRLSVSWSGG